MEWISVDQDMPKQLPTVYYSEEVVFVDESGTIYAGTYNREFKDWSPNSFSCGCCWEPRNITHWMRVDLPKEILDDR